MKNGMRFIVFSLLATLAFANFTARAQKGPAVLEDAEARRVIPSSFYFAGQSAETQIRNAAAATFGPNRFVVAGMVDTSGYSTEISGKYEGFLITDSPIRVGGRLLPIGAYGFGFAQAGKLRIFDLSSREIIAVPTFTDTEMKRPRPLQMIVDKKGIRFYKGKNYAVITAR